MFAGFLSLSFCHWLLKCTKPAECSGHSWQAVVMQVKCLGMAHACGSPGSVCLQAAGLQEVVAEWIENLNY